MNSDKYKYHQRVHRLKLIENINTLRVKYDKASGKDKEEIATKLYENKKRLDNFKN